MISEHHYVLEEYVGRLVDLEPAEMEEFLSYFKVAFIKKRQFIVQPNFVATHRNFIVDGALRAYVICEHGDDHTIQFAIKNWWISDYCSYVLQEPATMFVVALEDSYALQVDYESEQKLKAANPKFETFFRRMAERSTAFMQRRIVNNLTKTAEERLDHFQRKYPDIIQRVPQYALASFLGMTTEYLSKLRNKRM